MIKKKIFIFEDEPDIAGLLCRLFEKEGYQVMAFADRLKGFHKIKKNSQTF